jgi:hypothetical protein
MPKYIDITGKKFGSLSVIRRRVDLKKYKRAQWECLCDCGGKAFTFYDCLKRGVIKTCGLCLVNKNIGKKFGRLTIIKFTRCYRHLTFVWCRCECGSEKEYVTSYVIRGTSNNCGCLRKENLLKKASKKIGLKFGRLKIIKIHGKDEEGNTLFLCKCKCGNKPIIKTGNFKTIKSCGCLQPESVPKGENVASAKLKNYEANTIRQLYKSKSGYTTKKLAAMFNINIASIRRIINNQLYIEDETNK